MTYVEHDRFCINFGDCTVCGRLYHVFDHDEAVHEQEIHQEVHKNDV